MVTKVDGVSGSGALPAVPAGMSIADPDVKQKYNEALEKVLSTIERPRDIPWFKLSQAMADPGRTGNWAEGFGRAMGVLGKEQEAEEARALPVAQMRAQLAGQQYEMSKEEKALNAFANALGTTPQGIQSGMNEAMYSPMIMQRLIAATPQFYGSPKIMDMAKTLFGQHNDLAKYLLEARKQGVTENELVQKYGPKILDMVSGISPIGQSSTAPVAKPPAGAPQAPTTAAPNTLGAPAGVTAEDADAQKARGETPKAEGTATTAPTADTSGEKAEPQFGFTDMGDNKYRLTYSGRVVQFPPGTPQERIRNALDDALKLDGAIYQENMKADSKNWQDKIAEIMKYDDNATAQNLGRIDGILKIVQKNPQLTGLLQNAKTNEVFTNFIKALGAAAEQCIQIGQFGSISLPVQKFLETAAIPDRKDKAALAELTRYISQEFLASMKANRGVLGVNPTDNDARLFLAATAGTGNLAENIYSWAQTRRAEYDATNQMYKGWEQFRRQYGADKPAMYFDPSNKNSPYQAAIKHYTTLMDSILSNAPGMR
jgi:hypothetical protein